MPITWSNISLVDGDVVTTATGVTTDDDNEIPTEKKMGYVKAMKANKRMCKAITYLAHDIAESIAYDMDWNTDYPSKSEYVFVLSELLYGNVNYGHDSEMKDFYNKLTDTAQERLIRDAY